MSSKQKWFDCNGVELQAGDTVRDITSGREELVYECHTSGCLDNLNLGLNASNESFLEAHPCRTREIYPFDIFSYVTINGKRHLQDYEKVV